MDSNSRQWSSLPGDILCMIVGCLDSRIDVIQFRRVCYSWWSSVPLPSPLFLNLPYPVDQDKTNPSTDISGYFVLTDSFVYSIQPPLNTQSNSTSGSSTPYKPWIVRIQYLDSGKLILKDLFSSAPVRDMALMPSFLDLLDYGVKEICHTYTLYFVDQSGISCFNPCSEKGFSGVRQFAVSSNSGKVDDSFTVMVIKDGGTLAVWRIGDDKWISVGDTARNGSPYCTISYYRGKFYAVCDDKLTVSIDPSSLSVCEIAPSDKLSSDSTVLMESFGDLFLVGKSWSWFMTDWGENLEVSFVIEKLIEDEEQYKWVHGQELEGRLLFICADWCFLVAAKELPGYKPNCVFFVDRGYCKRFGVNDVIDSAHPFSDVVIHDGDDDTVIWLRWSSYEKLFWPPPSWLGKKTSTSSK